jgi:hypothetical protein
VSSPSLADPKIDTAGRSMRSTAAKPARNSSAIDRSFSGSARSVLEKSCLSFTVV